MGYTYRTSGPWGPGTGIDLTPTQIDNNFWQAVQDIAAKAVQGVGITNFVVAGNQMTVVLSDHTLLGPYLMPMMTLQFQGEWHPLTQYRAGDIITANGSTYMVRINHTSAATFDPNATDGMGNEFYGLLLQNPAATIPAGGPTGRFLRKASSADYSLAWQTASLAADLSDCLVTSPTNSQVLTYQGGKWINAAIPTSQLEGLSDVHISTFVNNGDVLTYEGGTWVNLPIPIPALSQLADCAISAPQPGQPLVWNGTDWADTSTVDMPCGGLFPAFGSITIDRTGGEVHRYQLTGTVTAVSIIGWPPGGRFARLVLEIQNLGGFGFAWPSAVKWPSGIVPASTPNGTDVFILISFDGGTTIYGNVVGQAFA
jgi:hypothetical protein